MYENMFTDMQDKMKPAMEMLEVNSSAVEKLLKQQAELFNELVSAGFEHSKAVAETKDFGALTELQKAFFANMGQKMMDTSKQNLDVLVGAKDSITKIVEASFKGVQAKAPKAAAAAAPAPAPKKAAAKAAAEKPAADQAAA